MTAAVLSLKSLKPTTHKSVLSVAAEMSKGRVDPPVGSRFFL